MASQNVRMMLPESVPRMPLPIDTPIPAIGDFYASCEYFAKCKTTKAIKFDHYYGYHPKASLTKLGKNIHEAIMSLYTHPLLYYILKGLYFFPL
ncbi:hypothetical protein [Acinetobacter pittii]|uniref:hypothetical protein n=1 Tax=Acinetobacter pittii TaxID=48296 RepID=UPI001D17140A|nr:hypothetical protein [Acinetobacter pittii]